MLSLPVPSLWKAMDADLFSNVTYRIRTESARQLFSLNAVTGELAVLQTLDFEDLAAMGMGTSFTFQVEAMDQGGVMPPGQATVTVRITVRAAVPPSLPSVSSELSLAGRLTNSSLQVTAVMPTQQWTCLLACVVL